MKIADMHVHSTFSPDGISTMEEQCQQAIIKEIPIICFTDHVDFNSAERNMDRITDNRGRNFDLCDYFGEIERLQNKYPSIEILSGIEFSEPHLFPDEFDEYQRYPFDYILASIHHCYNMVFPGAANLDEEQAVYEYYDLMSKSISWCSCQAIAHIDFPRRYFDRWRVQQRTLDHILKLIIQKGIALEINTSSITAQSASPMPEIPVLRRYLELGGSKVVLGSDAHDCKKLANGFSTVIPIIPEQLEIGYFKQRVFVPIKPN